MSSDSKQSDPSVIALHSSVIPIVHVYSVCISERLTDFNPLCCSPLKDCDYVITFAWG